MTKSYAQLKATIAKLEKEAAALRATETTKVVAQIRESIASFGLTVEQLFGRGAEALKTAAGKALGGGKAARKGAGIPKYRDPKTGKTWTGFGKAPSWIATVRNRDKLLIDQSGVVAAPPAKEAAAPVAPVAPVAKKSARKVRAVPTPVKTSSRAKKAEAAVPEAKAEKAVKKAATKKSVPSKKAPPAKKVAAAPNAAKAPKVAAKAPEKAASKAVKPKPAAKTRSPRTTTKAAAPVVTSAVPETAETGASAS
ncbi:H-NS family nucleoid-associated regulatory protein [Variovorax sp. YR216]|uniref:H-NS histone family protein n=1 Tax=Variovorax sp. YR216 TaxID=1882828 RepID=UPI0008977A1F|nr:H-NS histone family protein [Variovorax sp. YR216]SEB25321.1 DNA-binding protein H-NS [Variovorax sp. YR216]